MFATVVALLSGASALRPETGASHEGVAKERSFGVQPDFESRPAEQGLGDCAIYKDTLPGDALGDSSHSTVMALHFHDGAAKSTQRQQIFNLGQEWHMAERWSWSAHRGVDSIQFGAWGNEDFGSGQIYSADIAGARTISTTYDANTKNYSLYLDGVLSSSMILNQKLDGKDHGFNIESGQMLLGNKGADVEDIDFRGCIEGVDVYRRMLRPEEVVAASKRLLASMEPMPEIATDTAQEVLPVFGDSESAAEVSMDAIGEDILENSADPELTPELNELPAPELAPELLAHPEATAELVADLVAELAHESSDLPESELTPDPEEPVEATTFTELDEEPALKASEMPEPELIPELAESTEVTPLAMAERELALETPEQSEPELVSELPGLAEATLPAERVEAPKATGLKHPIVRASMAIALCGACVYAAFAPTKQ